MVKRKSGLSKSSDRKRHRALRLSRNGEQTTSESSNIPLEMNLQPSLPEMSQPATSTGISYSERNEPYENLGGQTSSDSTSRPLEIGLQPSTSAGIFHPERKEPYEHLGIRTLYSQSQTRARQREFQEKTNDNNDLSPNHPNQWAQNAGNGTRCFSPTNDHLPASRHIGSEGALTSTIGGIQNLLTQSGSTKYGTELDSDLSEEELGLFSQTYGPGFESDIEEEVSDTEDDFDPDSRFPGRNYENSTVRNSDIGHMTPTCVCCGALHFTGGVKSKCRVSPTTAKFVQCCSKGDVDLVEPKTEPTLIGRLFENNHVLSSHFKDHIRQYNSAMAFASMVAEQRALTPGPYSYVIHGQIYHSTGCLANETVDDSQYAQLYVLDSDQATELRMRRNDMVLNRTLLQEMSDILRRVNPFSRSYNMMHFVVTQNTDEQKEIFMLFDEEKHAGSRRHNAAAANEIAAVFVSNDGEVPTNRAVVVRPRGKEIRRISILSPFLDPMTYPLFFPYGERGWATGMKLKLHNGKNLTLRQYYAYRLGYRPASLLHRGGKLFQQYIVDAYSKIEENKLNFIRMNQTKLRAESYKGLMDHLENQAMEQDVAVGRRVILPSSFKGSPRHMAQNYQDAMTMVSKLGKSDLFVTFTCNPNWKEITEALLPGQKPPDRPDLVARVFKLKLDELTDDIFNKHVLGRVMGHVGVIEFQKRGLPHVHLLLTLQPDYKDVLGKEVSVSAKDCLRCSRKCNCQLYIHAIASFLRNCK